MKYEITKTIEAPNIQEALKREIVARVDSIILLEEEEKLNNIGFSSHETPRRN